MNLICWTLVILMDCCSDWGVVTLHQIDLIKWRTDHVSWVSSTTVSIDIELVEMIWPMDNWVPSVWALLILIIWVEVMVPSSIIIKTVNSLSTVHLVIVVRTSNVIQRTMMWPNRNLRSSGVIWSSVNCRTILIVTCIQRVTSSIHDVRLPHSIFIR